MIDCIEILPVTNQLVAGNMRRMATTLGERIREFREAKGWSQEQLAKQMGVSRESVTQWESGVTMPRPRRIRELSDKFETTPEFLQYGIRRLSHYTDKHANKLNDRERKENIPAAPQDLNDEERKDWNDQFSIAYELAKDFVLVPRYDVKASMGHGQIVHSEQVIDRLAFKRNWVASELGVDPKNLALISTVGDSMEPTLRPGDLILIDQSITTVRGDSIYVIQFDGELMAKRIQKLFDGSLVIKSDNPAYEQQRIEPERSDMIRIIGRVVWAGRRM